MCVSFATGNPSAVRAGKALSYFSTWLALLLLGFLEWIYGVSLFKNFSLNTDADMSITANGPGFSDNGWPSSALL